MLLAIDPGTTQSAYIVYGTAFEKKDAVLKKGIVENGEMLEMLRDGLLNHDAFMRNLYIEMVASYGMAVGQSVFETCVWTGRFIEAWGGPFEYVYRKDVKIHLCGHTRAKDSNIRQAIMDRYGSERGIAIGTKKAPGPLYGVSKDMWAALGVAITAAET